MCLGLVIGCWCEQLHYAPPYPEGMSILQWKGWGRSEGKVNFFTVTGAYVQIFPIRKKQRARAVCPSTPLGLWTAFQLICLTEEMMVFSNIHSSVTNCHWLWLALSWPPKAIYGLRPINTCTQTFLACLFIKRRSGGKSRKTPPKKCLKSNCNRIDWSTVIIIYLSAV